jgi:fermentation-respiration switch protein FrsA (DUF1100 family)
MIDSKAIIEYVLNNKKIDSSNVFLLGASLGGAVTIYASQDYQDIIQGIVLINTFISLPEVVEDMNFIFKIFSPLLLMNYWPSEERIKNITLPILFISGEEDEMISPKQMDRLYKAAQGSSFTKMYKVKDGDHNNIWYIN